MDLESTVLSAVLDTDYWGKYFKDRLCPKPVRALHRLTVWKNEWRDL